MFLNLGSTFLIFFFRLTVDGLRDAGDAKSQVLVDDADDSVSDTNKSNKATAPIVPGCRNFNKGLRVPDADTMYVDNFFADHKQFMEKSQQSGDAEPRALMYVVTKQPEPVDPTNASAGTTGNTLYALTETYRGLKGCRAHVAAAQAFNGDGKILARFMEILGKYSTFYSGMSMVIHTVADHLPSALANVKPGYCTFNFGLKVPEADESSVDELFADHKQWVDKTHPTSGDKGPVVLFYTVTKAPEPKDPGNPSAGFTGNTLYALTEIYPTFDACMAHVEMATKNGIASRIQDAAGKYGTFVSNFAEVAFTIR